MIMVESESDSGSLSSHNPRPVRIRARFLVIAALALHGFSGACSVESPSRQAHHRVFPDLRGPYLGQPQPGTEPLLFAPGVVSTGLNEDGGLVFTPSGDELFIRIAESPFGIVARMMRIDDRWQPPQVASFSGRYYEGRLAISPSGDRLYFSSPMPLGGTGPPKDKDIWYVERQPSGWGRPKNLGPPINSEADEIDFSFAASGTIYFNREGPDVPFDIYRADLINGRYAEPVPLGPPVNSDHIEVAPTIAPDESYLVFTSGGRPDQIGSLDLYVTFRNAAGGWNEPVNLGEPVNSPDSEKLSTLSPDGRFLFFVSRRSTQPDWSETPQSYEQMLTRYDSPENGECDIYWVSTEVIERLRPE